MVGGIWRRNSPKVIKQKVDK